MHTLLLTFCTRPIAIRIAKLLNEKFNLVYATSEEIPSVFHDKYVKIPVGEDSSYAHKMLTMALDKGVNYIVPFGASEVRALSESILLFEEYDITVVCPTKEELLHMDVLFDPSKDIALSLVVEKRDLLTELPVQIQVNGLGMLSDEGNDFILAVIK